LGIDISVWPNIVQVKIDDNTLKFSGDTIYVNTVPLNIYDLINTNSGLTGDTLGKIKVNVDDVTITFNDNGALTLKNGSGTSGTSGIDGSSGTSGIGVWNKWNIWN